MAQVALAIEMGVDAVDIGKTIHPHPTRWARVLAWQRRWRMAVAQMYRLRGNSATVFKLS